ncbi:lipase family protein [Xanthomonas sacchari]
MKVIDQALADASNDSYANRSQRDVGDNNRYVSLDGQDYKIFGYASDPATGFHATAYQSVASPHNVIVAYRGTDPGLFSGQSVSEKADHALTTLQDIAVDAKMVRDTVNAQKSAADAFTAQMIAKAAAQGIPKTQIFAAGHSLGGALAELQAAKYGLRGATYNGFGAADMIDGPPQPGFQLTNYRMAGDVVSAASPHVGKVVSLASEEDIQSLRAGRYLDAPPGSAPPNALIAMRLSDHGGQQHFSSDSPDNILQPQRFQEATQRYAANKDAIDRFGSDVSFARAELSESLRQMRGNDGQGQLSPNLRRQLNEYLVLNADPAIRDTIARGAPVRGVADGLQHGADAVRAGGRYVQALDERIAIVAREGGRLTAPFIPVAPLAGHVVSEAARLHGQGADAAARWVGGGLESAKGAVERGAHAAADAVVERIHDPRFQAGVANVANHIVDAYDGARVAAQTATQTYQLGKQAVSDGIDRAERAVAQTYDATKHMVTEGAEQVGRAATQAYGAAKHVVIEGAEQVGRAATQTYDATKHVVTEGAQQVGRAATQTYDAAKHVVIEGAEQVGRAATQTYDATKHVVTEGAQQVGRAATQTYDAAKHVVTEGAEQVGRAATQTYDASKHVVTEGVAQAGRAATSAYDAAKQAADSAARVGTHAYEAARQTATQGIDAAKHAAGKAYDTLTQPGQWFQRSAPAQAPAATPASGVQSAPSTGHKADREQNLAALPASDQTMFARIRRDVPTRIDDAHVAQAMLGAKRAGIADADKIDRVQMAGDTLWVSGTTPGFRAATDVAQAAAPMHETVQQAQAFNQQRAQHLAMEAQQRLQDAPGGRGAPAIG